MMDYLCSHQETLESILASSSSGTAKAPSVAHQQEKKPRPADQHALKCPRCDSTNTKFCYYNNYSLSQPRYFCKSCRRYWTKGGTLRNVPVGGGCRKNKRISASSNVSSRRTAVAQQEAANSGAPGVTYDQNDVALAIARFQKQQQQQQHSSFRSYDDLGFWGNPTLNSNPTPNLRFGDSLGIVVDPQQQDQMMLYGEMGFRNQDLGIVPYEGYANASDVKQKICKENGDGSRVLWGFPFGGNGGADFGIGGCSTWHGLVNSPLM